MRVLFMRHGEAIDRFGLADELRWLTDEGRKRTRRVARHLDKEEGLRFDVIFTSPLVRAVQTAELLALVGGFEGPLEVHPPLGTRGGIATALAPLADVHDGKLVAMVGHEPHMSAYAEHLLGVEAWPEFKKSAALLLVRKDGQYTFEWYLRPSRLEKVTSLEKLRGAGLG